MPQKFSYFILLIILLSSGTGIAAFNERTGINELGTDNKLNKYSNSTFNSITTAFYEISGTPFEPFTDTTPVWEFNGYYMGINHKVLKYIEAGDLNGDGFDDLVVQTELYSEIPSRAFIYFGSPQGLKDTADIIQTLRRVHSQLFAIGDVNDDGFDDMIHHNDFQMSGSPNGFRVGGLGIDPYIGLDNSDDIIKAFPAGDINGDGVNDVIFTSQYENITYTYLGRKVGGLYFNGWISPRDPFGISQGEYLAGSAGDLNNDGYGDVFVNAVSGYGFVFLGSAAGLNEEPHWTIPYIETSDIPEEDRYRKMIPGNFNNDQYDDLMIVSKRFLELSDSYYFEVYFVYGNSTGLDTENPRYIFTQIFHPDLGTGDNPPVINSFGDLNNDGLTDFSIDGKIVYGYELNFIGRANPFYSEYKYIHTMGDFNGDSANDIFTYDANGKVQLHYYQLPFVSGNDTIKFCNYGPDHRYTIPLNTRGYIEDIAHSKTGATVDERFTEGSFIHNFNPGYTTLNYFVSFYGLQFETWSTVVHITDLTPTDVSIKEAYAQTPGGDANTIYVGYGADGFRLAALPTGGAGPYSYLWSNGSIEKNPKITETVPGEYPYWVKMTNTHGCESSDTTIIKVENALCSSPLVDAVMSQYPMILQNPVLANLIKSNSKIAVCKDGQTMCFTKAVVDVRITRPGYSIGACTPGIIPAEAFMTDEIENILSGELKVIVAPNPSSNSFQLSVISIYNAPVLIRIMDLAGRQVEVLNNASANQTITVGHKLRAGTYIAEVVSGKERKVVKLVKMQ